MIVIGRQLVSPCRVWILRKDVFNRNLVISIYLYRLVVHVVLEPLKQEGTISGLDVINILFSD